MNLIKYNNEYVKLINVEEQSFIGMAYFMDADTAEEQEDMLTIKSAENEFNSFIESEIKSIEILD